MAYTKFAVLTRQQKCIFGVTRWRTVGIHALITHSQNEDTYVMSISQNMWKNDLLGGVFLSTRQLIRLKFDTLWVASSLWLHVIFILFPDDLIYQIISIWIKVFLKKVQFNYYYFYRWNLLNFKSGSDLSLGYLWWGTNGIACTWKSAWMSVYCADVIIYFI